MSSILSVRLSDEERSLLEMASGLNKIKIRDFVRREALKAAEINILKQTRLTIPANHWKKFEVWAYQPAQDNEALCKLAKTTPTWLHTKNNNKEFS